MAGNLAEMNIVDQLSLKQLRNDYKDEPGIENYEVQAAVFLTYSVDPKVILTLIHSLFFEKQETQLQEPRRTKEEAVELIGSILEEIYGEGPQNMAIKDKFAVFYNNGSKPVEEKLSVADTVAMQFAYPVTVDRMGSFHPKVYIVKFGNETHSIYRFMVSSHNLTNSGCLEYGYCFDRECVSEAGNVENTGWEWLNNLLKADVMDQTGNQIDTSTLPAIKLLQKGKPSFMPEMLVHSFENTISADQLKAIYSPFLSSKFLSSDTITIYTTHMELKKHGYEPCEKYEKDAKEFYIFSPEDSTEADNYSIPHYKVYLTKEDAYAGSLNYTESAFHRNKEILVKLSQKPDIPDSWYQKKYYHCISNLQIKRQDIRDAFKNLIRENCENGTLFLQCNEKNIITQLSLALKPESQQSGVEELAKQLNNAENSYCIWVYPEYMPEKKQKLMQSIHWKLKASDCVSLRSSTICYELVEKNSNGREKKVAAYVRSYPLQNGEDLLKQNIQREDIISFFNLKINPETVLAGAFQSFENRKDVISTERFRQTMKLYSLEELLASEPQRRDRMIKLMSQRLQLLNTLFSHQIDDLNEEEIEEEILDRIGCRARDRLIWLRLIKQANDVCIKLGRGDQDE